MRARYSFAYFCVIITVSPVLLLSGEAVAELVNINTASKSQLDELPSIGPKRAQSIIDYRESHGPFRSREDIMKVHGIGKGILGQIKDSITVGASIEARERASGRAAAAPAPPPRRYTGKNYVARSCWSCKNTFQIPDELDGGWCPFCGRKWSVR